MKKYDDFIEKIDRSIASNNNTIEFDKKQELRYAEDRIVFRAMVRERKYELRRIAAQSPLYAQHGRITQILKNLYMESNLKLGSDYEKFIEWVVRRDIGVLPDGEIILMVAYVYTVICWVTLYITTPFDEACPLYVLSLLSSILVGGLIVLCINGFELKFRLYRLK